jgi:hypothetical protein
MFFFAIEKADLLLKTTLKIDLFFLAAVKTPFLNATATIHLFFPAAGRSNFF